jgi:hypothetical protein
VSLRILNAGVALRLLLPLTFAAALLLPAIAWASPLLHGDALPPLVGRDLAGRRVALPAAAAGHPTLLLLGFSYASRHAVDAFAPSSAPTRRCDCTNCR